MKSRVSIEDVGWLEANDRFVTFSSMLLPDNQLHLTVSYDERSEFVNFHVTKNGPKGVKIYYKVVKIQKDDYDIIAPYIKNYMARIVFRPFRLPRKKWSSKYFGNYLSLKEVGETSYFKSFAKTITAFLEKNAKQYEGRYELNITRVIQDELKDYVSSEIEKEQFLQYLKPFNSCHVLENDYGVFNSGSEVKTIFRKDSRWYEMKSIQSLEDMIFPIVESDTIKILKEEYLKGILLVANAKSQSDIPEQFPVLLKPTKEFLQSIDWQTDEIPSND